MQLRIQCFIGLFIMLSFLTACQQKQVIVTPSTNIRPIAPIKNHYETLQKLSTNTEASRSELDVIQYPSKAYGWVASLLRPAYLKKEQLKEMYLKLDLPANSSQQTRAELDFLLDLQKNRTEQKADEVLAINEIVYVPMLKTKELDLFYICTTIMGTDVKAENYPHTEKLLHNIMKESRIMEFSAKNHFMRARPRQLESRLQPLDKINTPSFASGHTLWAYLQSYVLAALIPEKNDAFIDLAYEIGYSREVLGVHYPSDEEAARQLSYKMFEAMWLTEKFQEDFKMAKAEWKK